MSEHKYLVKPLDIDFVEIEAPFKVNIKNADMLERLFKEVLPEEDFRKISISSDDNSILIPFELLPYLDRIQKALEFAEYISKLK